MKRFRMTYLVFIKLMVAQEKRMHHMSITVTTFHTVFVFEQKSNQQHDKKKTLQQLHNNTLATSHNV